MFLQDAVADGERLLIEATERLMRTLDSGREHRGGTDGAGQVGKSPDHVTSSAWTLKGSPRQIAVGAAQ